MAGSAGYPAGLSTFPLLLIGAKSVSDGIFVAPVGDILGDILRSRALFSPNITTFQAGISGIAFAT